MEREKKRAILLGIPAAVCLLFGLLITINHVVGHLPFFVRGILLCSSLCPLPLVLALGATEKSLAPSSLHLPSGIYGP